jgi:uncharacterized protein with NAD-binding domain and iron-sulfur cluster
VASPGRTPQRKPGIRKTRTEPKERIEKLPPAPPIRVAIIGGGCASITTAFELSRPEHQGRYEITVYQQGWRLGGKGASGRGPGDRIEEHGLHLWMGHYDNAFQLMRECYRELGRDPRHCPIADWTDAFAPAPLVSLTDPTPDGGWRLVSAHFPPFPGLPGDPFTVANPRTVPAYLARIARLLVALLRSAQEMSSGSPARPDAGADRAEPPDTEADAERVEALVESVSSLLKVGQLATLTAVIQAVALLEPLCALLPRLPRRLADRYFDFVSGSARRLLEPLLAGDAESRFLWEIIDLVLATLRGSIRFGLATHPRGFEAIDDYDSRDWLRMNGASERALNSTFLRGLYDLAFAYEDGDPGRPGNAAGQGLRGLFRMFFNYRGSLFWKMQAGMGDIVFAPYYEVLRRRGVRFEFFHRLENVRLADEASLAPGEKPFVEALEFDVQAHVAGGGEYRPLIDVDGLPCWPSEPDWSQLEGGARLRDEGRDFECFWDRRRDAPKVLEVRRDFDCVVLGVSVGAIPHVCSEIVARDRRWRDMVENVKTVATQSFQVWLNEPMESLGWKGPPATLSGFVEPYDTWADMTHLVPTERIRPEPGAIAYFCSVLRTGPTPDRTERDHPREAREVARRGAIEFLNRDVVHLWPKALRAPGRFRWELLVDPHASAPVSDADEARFDTQFWVANVNPSDRYVLSLPGTLRYRISPLDTTYGNLTITGDWTDCGFNFGCVEAAVMSGRLAAHAVSLRPRLEDIFGYDHP